jgi:hypothetical protein
MTAYEYTPGPPNMNISATDITLPTRIANQTTPLTPLPLEFSRTCLAW